MIGRVIDVADFRNAFLEHHFNPLFESHINLTTPLAPTTKLKINISFFNSMDTDNTTIGSNHRIDLVDQKLLHLVFDAAG